MTAVRQLRVTVIATAKRGLESFVYGDLEYLERSGCHFDLCPTKQGPGLYPPKPSWSFRRWHPAVVVAMQPLYWARWPVRYSRLLLEAIRFRALPELALAWHFSSTAVANDVIWATFGDRKLFVGYFCKRITHKPLAVTIHAYEIYDSPNEALFLRALRHCDVIFTRTEHNRELLAERYAVDPAEVVLERNSIDFDFFTPDEKFVVLIVGFFVERKGHEVLFEALRRIDGREIEVWVVGDVGAEEPVDVRRLAHEIGVDDRVIFFGAQGASAIRALLRACDVFCLPCHFDRRGIGEGFPNAIIEAMAMGKPIVTTRHVEIPNVLNEVLVPENDPDSLAAAIEALARAPDRRARLGASNLELVRRYFPPENRAEMLRNIRRAAFADADAAGTEPTA